MPVEPSLPLPSTPSAGPLRLLAEGPSLRLAQRCATATVTSVSRASPADRATGLALLPRRAVEVAPEATVQVDGRDVRFEPLPESELAAWQT